jgi:putative restriction endonuclease
VRDDDVRASCFAQLAILCAEHGDDVPYAGALERGFTFRGRRVPYLNRQKGIYRAAAQKGPAALSIQTSYASPYGDAVTDEGVVLRRTSIGPSSSSSSRRETCTRYSGETPRRC